MRPARPEQENVSLLTTIFDRSAWRAMLRRVAAAALASAWCAAPAAATQVYHSPNDDGAPAAGQPTIAEGGVQPVYLYVDGGATASAPGSVCDTGQGDEVCGYTISLTGADGLTLSGFVADGAADLMVNQSGNSIVINGLDPVSPTAGPKRIGVLSVNATAGGSLSHDGGEVVGADLGSEVLAAETIAFVPEPAGIAVWAMGISLLGVLGRRRAAQC